LPRSELPVECRCLNESAGQQGVASARAAFRCYGTEVREALIILWEASDRICSKRLKPLIPALLPALERHRRLAITASYAPCCSRSARRASTGC
jgi:hypothetical protein